MEKCDHNAFCGAEYRFLYNEHHRNICQRADSNMWKTCTACYSCQKYVVDGKRKRHIRRSPFTMASCVSWRKRRKRSWLFRSGACGWLHEHRRIHNNQERQSFSCNDRQLQYHAGNIHIFNAVNVKIEEVS